LASTKFFRVFQIFKYCIYSLLALNVYLFFADEWTAANHLFIGGVNLEDIFQAFSASIDTAAWVVLLLLFEMETYVLSDTQVERHRWSLHGVRILSYFFILLSYQGYWAKALDLYEVSPLQAGTACELVDHETFYMTTLDEFEALTLENCQELPAEGGFVQLNDTDIISDAEVLSDTRALAWLDVFNASLWLLIVVMLELDVWMQLKEKESRVYTLASGASKVILYSGLLIAALYWGWAGAFIDFWDAFLWLVAFVFIEMNVINWREESEEEHSPEAQADISPG
jgi:hypothetical protein